MRNLSDKIKIIIYFLGIIFIGLGMLSLNLVWITFIAILIAMIFKVHYVLFSLTHLSLIGTPLELFIGGIILIVLGRIIMRVERL